MARSTYRYFGRTNWMGLSGNAVFALVNKAGSNKKISITSVEVYNNSKYGYTNIATNSLNPSSAMFKVAYVTGTGTGGTALTPTNMDSSYAAFPSQITVKTGTSYTPTYRSVFGTTTYTQAAATAGALTFTPDAAPSWTASAIKNNGNYLVVASGSNAGTYKIIANTTTALTLDKPLPATASTTGTVCELDDIVHCGYVKLLAPANAILPNNNIGVYMGRPWDAGNLWHAGTNSNTQGIYFLQNETLAVVCDFQHSGFPCQVDIVVVIEGSPNRTYVYTFYTYLDGENQTIVTLANAAASGITAKLVDISITELGTSDTCYFQMVPLGSIDPIALTDSAKKLTATPMNSTDGALSSGVCELYSNVPVLPSKVPTSYIADGAPAAAVPRGFNYLNSKDFIGPQYAVFFPEAATFKLPDTTFWTTQVPGNLGASHSQKLANISTSNPIVVREGEAFGIVSGAETATIASAIGISGWGSFEIGVTFTVDDARTPSLTITGMIANSRYEVYSVTNGTQLTSGTTTTGTEVISFIWSVPQSIRIRVRKASTAGQKYLPYEVTTTMTSADLSVPISQIRDTIA